MMGSEHPRPEPADDWRQQAACATADPDLFYASEFDADAIDRAKSVCRVCPSQAACLNYAIDHREDHGIWGGATEDERRKIRRRRARANQPPKPIDHGTERGFAAHRRQGDDPCDDCRAAMRRAENERQRANRAKRKAETGRSRPPAVVPLSWSARHVLRLLDESGPTHIHDLHSQVAAALVKRGLVTIDACGMVAVTEQAKQAAS